MKIEAGKRYKMRNGNTAGPVTEDPSAEGRVAFECLERVDGYFGMWNSQGRAEFFGSGDEAANRQYDLMKEVK